LSKQKHDLGRIKKTKPCVHPAKNRSERRKARSERITANYDRAEKHFHDTEQKRREKQHGKQAQADQAG
jgi:hypothetical protein